MKQPSEQEKNIVGKALYDLIGILNEIDLEVEKKGENQEEVIVEYPKR